MPKGEPPPRPWLIALSRPYHLAIAAIGPILTSIDPHLVWTIPAAFAAYGALVVRELQANRGPQGDPLALAGPDIRWLEALPGLISPEARALIGRLEEIDRNVTRLAREAQPESQAVLVVALGEIREAARAGLSIAIAIDRLETQLAAASPMRAKIDSVTLHVRAMIESDREASASLYAAAEQRAAHADRADEIAALRTRMLAESERLVAELDRAALDAVSIATRPISMPKVRIDVAVARETLADLDRFEEELARDASQPSARSRTRDR